MTSAEYFPNTASISSESASLETNILDCEAKDFNTRSRDHARLNAGITQSMSFGVIELVFLRLSGFSGNLLCSGVITELFLAALSEIVTKCIELTNFLYDELFVSHGAPIPTEGVSTKKHPGST